MPRRLRAWRLRGFCNQSAVTSVIIGARTNEQLVDNLGATDLKLTPDDLTALNNASALPSEYPGWMLERQSSDRASVVK